MFKVTKRNVKEYAVNGTVTIFLEVLSVAQSWCVRTQRTCTVQIQSSTSHSVIIQFFE